MNAILVICVLLFYSCQASSQAADREALNNKDKVMIKRLDELIPRQNGLIKQVRGFGALRQRMMDMGLVPGADIEVVRVAPMGDPIEYCVKGYHLSLRGHEAKNILVEVNTIVLDKAQKGDLVRIISFSAGRQASRKLMEMGLQPGDTLEILRNEPSGKILVKSNEKQIEIGRGLAGKMLVEILPVEVSI